MRKEYLPISCLVIFSLGFSAFRGCGKAASLENPTPEEARSALIELAESDDFEQDLHLSREEIEAVKSKKAINELRNAKICPDGAGINIGPWKCYLSQKRFSRVLRMTPMSSHTLEGRFTIGRDGRWKAVLDGTYVADFTP